MTMHKVSTTWEVPERYLNLSPVGSGAFGQVSIIGIMKMTSHTLLSWIRYVQRRTQNGEAKMEEMCGWPSKRLQGHFRWGIDRNCSMCLKIWYFKYYDIKCSYFKHELSNTWFHFQSAIHAKRTYRELRMLKHMRHENVSLSHEAWKCQLFSILINLIRFYHHCCLHQHKKLRHHQQSSKKNHKLQCWERRM